MMVLKGKTDKH